VRHFNAPPGWPEPPTMRWRPPKRWSPHEFWPPAPADWPFWVGEDGRRVKGPLGRYGGPSLRPLVATAATAGVLVAVCGFVLFGSFGGSDDTTQRTALPSVFNTDIPPPPTVALPTPGATGAVTPTVTPTPSSRPLLATVSPTPSTVSSPTSPSQRAELTSQRAELPSPTPTPSETVSAVSYKSCAEVRAAGKAPLHRGDPGYSRKLDKNGDGVACDRGNS
jgi:hypothetical protein